MPTRKRRGRESEILVAEHLRALFPYARAANSGARGCDVQETPAVAVEVKSRRGLDLPGWLRQAHRNGHGALPLLVIRPDGMGPASVGSWAAVVTLDDLLELLAAAGYGTPTDDAHPTP